jgi:hypothetical protein
VEIVLKDNKNCLPVRQIASAPDSVDKKICVAQDATDLSQKDPGFETDLSQSEGSHLYSKTQDTKLQDNNPLPPSQANGEFVSPSSSSKDLPACEVAVRKVMRELNLTERRMIPVIARAIEGYRAKTDDPPNCNAVAELMVAARQNYMGLGELLRCPVGVRKFFGLGVWANSQEWVLDKDELRRQRRL